MANDVPWVRREAAGIFLSLLLCGLLASSVRAFPLTVLHTNDVHAAYSGFNANHSDCYEQHCPKGTGGFVRMKRTIEALRHKHENVLTLDAGDQIQGSLFSTLFGAEASYRMMREIGYDVATLGNHEFDKEKSIAEAYIRHLSGRIVCANIEGLDGLLPWKILERQGQRIGIVGLLTPETAFLDNPGPQVRFTDPKETLLKSLRALNLQGVKTVIVLSHLGLDVDKELAAQVSGVCLWVSAHTHSLLGNRPGTDGPYPIFVKDKEGHRVALVSTGSAGRHLGVLHLQIDSEGLLDEAHGDTFELNDALLKTLAAPELSQASQTVYENLFREVRKKVGMRIGRVEGSRFPSLDNGDPSRCRKAGCELGEILTDSLRQATGAQIVLAHAGVIRASFPNDSLYECHVQAAFPFGNTLAYIPELEGRVIRRMLEHGLANYGPGKGSGRFLQASGLSYTFDPSKPAGERLAQVLVHPEGAPAEPLRDDLSYRVVTIDYLMGGGDGYDFLKAIPFHALKHHRVDTVLKHYFLRHDRVKIIHRDIAQPIH